MSYKSKKNTISRWANLDKTSKNQTAKNQTKVCNLGIHGTTRPCCNKTVSGEQCHIKPSLLDHRKRMSRGDTIEMAKEHDAYKEAENNIMGTDGSSPTKYDIARRINVIGLDAVKDERDCLKNIINMRTEWLKKWYVQPTPSSDCYTCDANARNHNVRIEILNKSLEDYNELILRNENKTALSNRTRSNSKSKRRTKMNLTRKKDNSYRVDSVARRQKLVAMLARKKRSQDRRKKSSTAKRVST